MAVGRYARHTKPQMLKAIREKVLYATDLHEGAGGATLSFEGASPYWPLGASASNYVIGDLKVPLDRVRGTDAQIYVVFYQSNVPPGGGNVVLYIEYAVVGIGESVTKPRGHKTDIVYGVKGYPGTQWSHGFWIYASEMDGLENADIQMAVGRSGPDGADTAPADTRILKVVFRYTAYV